MIEAAWKKKSRFTGASLAEYGLLAGLVSVVSIGAVYGLGSEVGRVFDTTRVTLEKNRGIAEADGFSAGEAAPLPVNTPPNVPSAIASSRTVVNTPVAHRVAGFGDADGDVIVVGDLRGPWPVWASAEMQGSELVVSGTPAAAGLWEGLQVGVTDGTDTVYTPPFDLVVDPGNAAPVVPEAITFASVEVHRPAALVAGGFSDPDGDTLSVDRVTGSWPSWATVSMSGGDLRVDGTPEASGTWVGLGVIVTDGTDNVASPTFDIAVDPTSEFVVEVASHPTSSTTVGANIDPVFGTITESASSRIAPASLLTTVGYSFLSYDGDVISKIAGKNLECDRGSWRIPTTVVATREERDVQRDAGNPVIGHWDDADSTVVSWPTGTGPMLSLGESWTCRVE